MQRFISMFALETEKIVRVIAFVTAAVAGMKCGMKKCH